MVIGITLKGKKLNKSGIEPIGNKVLVKADLVEKVTEGGIFIPESVTDRHQMSSCYGHIVAMGADCFIHTTQTIERWIDNAWRPVERKVTGYSKAFAEVGDRIAFSMYSGRSYTGLDGVEYQLITDEEIISLIDEGVVQTSIEARKALGS